MELIDHLQAINNGVNNPYCSSNFITFRLIQEISEQNRPYFIGGAVSLVLSSGQIYRCHQDFDLFALPEDFEYWGQFFADRGYEMVEDIDRNGKQIFRGMQNGKWVFDAKFFPFETLADDGNPYEIVTAQIGPYVVNIVNPEYNKWQKAWMFFRGEGRLKDRRDLEMYG